MIDPTYAWPFNDELFASEQPCSLAAQAKKVRGLCAVCFVISRSLQAHSELLEIGEKVPYRTASFSVYYSEEMIILINRNNTERKKRRA